MCESTNKAGSQSLVYVEQLNGDYRHNPGIMSFTNNGRDSALRCPRRPKRRIEKVMVSIHFAQSYKGPGHRSAALLPDFLHLFVKCIIPHNPNWVSVDWRGYFVASGNGASGAVQLGLSFRPRSVFNPAESASTGHAPSQPQPRAANL
jgi:hypothetical protein